jgi:hypothetical protein
MNDWIGVGLWSESVFHSTRRTFTKHLENSIGKGKGKKKS